MAACSPALRSRPAEQAPFWASYGAEGDASGSAPLGITAKSSSPPLAAASFVMIYSHTIRAFGTVMTQAQQAKRIAVTLSPSAYSLVLRVSELANQSQSSVVAEVMDMAMPALQQMLGALEIVKKSPLEAQRMMSRLAAEATRDVAQAQIDFDESIDARTVEGKRKRRAQGAPKS